LSLCENAGLYVEKAYILLENGEKEEAVEILVNKCININI